MRTIRKRASCGPSIVQPDLSPSVPVAHSPAHSMPATTSHRSPSGDCIICAFLRALRVDVFLRSLHGPDAGAADPALQLGRRTSAGQGENRLWAHTLAEPKLAASPRPFFVLETIGLNSPLHARDASRAASEMAPGPNSPCLRSIWHDAILSDIARTQPFFSIHGRNFRAPFGPRWAHWQQGDHGKRI